MGAAGAYYVCSMSFFLYLLLSRCAISTYEYIESVGSGLLFRPAIIS